MGTSEKMVDKIAEVLELGEIERRIYIEDVASQYEIEQARKIRTQQGKHVIPVPAVQLKITILRVFSGSFAAVQKKGQRHLPENRGKVGGPAHFQLLWQLYNFGLCHLSGSETYNNIHAGNGTYNTLQDQ